MWRHCVPDLVLEHLELSVREGRKPAFSVQALCDAIAILSCMQGVCGKYLRMRKAKA